MASNYTSPGMPGAWGPGVNWAPMNAGPYTWSPNSASYQQFPQPVYGGTQVQGVPRTSEPPFCNVVKVAGPESADAYHLPPNSFAVLFHATEPVFYAKTTDDGGFATKKRFRFFEDDEDSQPGEQVEPPEAAKEMDVLKKDVEALASDISEMKKMLEGLVN